jgi:glycosyltransferase involved in cell wall biosynthesis
MIKVLQSVSSLGIGGNELSVMNFFRNIDKTKFQVDFLIYDERLEFAEEVKAAGSKIYLCPQKKTNKLARVFYEAKFAYRTLKENDYDIIHCNGCSFVNIMRAAIPAKLVGKVKIIAHGHSVGKRDKNPVERVIYAILRKILSACVHLGFSCSDLAAQSKYTRKFLNSDRQFLIRNAIEVEKFVFDQNNRDEIRKQYGLENKMVIGHVGRLSAEKNQGFLMDVLASLRSKRDDAVLLLVGGGDMMDELKEKAARLGVEKHVVFTDSVFDAERYYSAMDVFAMPSLYEGLPFTAIEAQVNGLKCVFSDGITKTANISGDVLYAALSDGFDVWAEKICQCAECRSEKSKNQLVIEQYDIKGETLRLQEIYQSVL